MWGTLCQPNIIVCFLIAHSSMSTMSPMSSSLAPINSFDPGSQDRHATPTSHVMIACIDRIMVVSLQEIARVEHRQGNVQRSRCEQETSTGLDELLINMGSGCER